MGIPARDPYGNSCEFLSSTIQRVQPVARPIASIDRWSDSLVVQRWTIHPWVGLGWGELGSVQLNFLASVVGWVEFNDTVMVGSNDCVFLI